MTGLLTLLEHPGDIGPLFRATVAGARRTVSPVPAKIAG